MISTFLHDQAFITWEPSKDFNLNCKGVFIGNGSNAVEILLTSCEKKPSRSQMIAIWKERKGHRPNPVLLVTLYGDKAGVCGPSGELPFIHKDLDTSIAERISREALKKQNRHSAHRFLQDTLSQLDDKLVGLRNQGFLSNHELKVGVPERKDWFEAMEKASTILEKSGKELLEKLGYSIEPLSGSAYLLKDSNRDTAIAILLEEGEEFDLPLEKFSGQSPISYALNKAEEKRIEYVIASSGSTIRLYTSNPVISLGSRGRTDTFIEINLNLLLENEAGYLWLLLSAEALREDGSFREIVKCSQDYTVDLRNRLRDRIYDDVIPALSKSIAHACKIENPTRSELDGLYRMTLILLYRLIFIAYAEDEGFLPRNNLQYESRSLKKKAHDLNILLKEEKDFDATSTLHWDDVMQLCQAIHDGNKELNLPQYDGTLLSSDPYISPEGAKLAKIKLTNMQFGLPLAKLLIDKSEQAIQGPIDFRNLGVRELGIIYEGLLESELSIADQPLTTIIKKKKQIYVPVENDEEAEIKQGEIYLHGLSGERKSSGTYYTKTLFVEHLLDYSLDFALDEHLKYLDSLTDREAGEKFFDFRVADIAMGSGHFLISAIDRIEIKLSSYLTERQLPDVIEELERLKEKAQAVFEDTESFPEIEDSQLLRRQIARHCIYGVDVNPLATELARLSIWIHTFVPGLPLTFLDHNLVVGDSLSGIGSLGEAEELLPSEHGTLFNWMPETKEKMQQVREEINKFGKITDADASEIKEARETVKRLEKELKGLKALFDILAASRINDIIDIKKIDRVKNMNNIFDLPEHKIAIESLQYTDPVHFPITFPEVFQGNNPGFNVIIGNPPWEEATLEEDEFWMRYEPGLQGKTQTEQERIKEKLKIERPDLVKRYENERESQEKRREILRNGPYPGMGTGDPDTYKAFCWRFWNLVKQNGYVGVVLPRSVFIAAGSELFRRNLLENGIIKDLTFLTNNHLWVFDTHPQYTIALIGFRKQESTKDTLLPLRGPYPSSDTFKKRRETDPFQFSLEKARNWTDTAAFPLLPTDPKALEVFKKMSEFPSLSEDIKGEWRARPHTELHATNDKRKGDIILMHFTDDPPDNYWPIFKGESFDIWNHDTGIRYAWVDPEIMIPYLQEKRQNSYERAGKRSAFYEMPKEWIYSIDTLSCFNPRIVFRDVSRATDQRTIRTALIPPNVFITNTSPYLIWIRGDEKDEAFLLGILSSIPLDWFARRFVETHVNYHILNALPIPRPNRDSKLWQRVVQLSGRMAAIDDRYKEWAQKIGVDYGSLSDEKKNEMIYELDAVVAHLYTLDKENIEVIFKTFHRGWKYKDRLNKVLAYYDLWEERLHG